MLLLIPQRVFLIKMYRKQLKSTIYSNKTEAADAAGNVPNFEAN